MDSIAASPEKTKRRKSILDDILPKEYEKEVQNQVVMEGAETLPSTFLDSVPTSTLPAPSLLITAFLDSVLVKRKDPVVAASLEGKPFALLAADEDTLIGEEEDKGQRVPAKLDAQFLAKLFI